MDLLTCGLVFAVASGSPGATPAPVLPTEHAWEAKIADALEPQKIELAGEHATSPPAGRTWLVLRLQAMPTDPKMSLAFDALKIVDPAGNAFPAIAMDDPGAGPAPQFVRFEDLDQSRRILGFSPFLDRRLVIGHAWTSEARLDTSLEQLKPVVACYLDGETFPPRELLDHCVVSLDLGVHQIRLDRPTETLYLLFAVPAEARGLELQVGKDLRLALPAPTSVATAARAKDSSPAPAETSWRKEPLVMKGAPAPQGLGSFQEFGEIFGLGDAFAFWARVERGHSKKWGLFSVKGGKGAKVGLDGQRLAIEAGIGEGTLRRAGRPHTNLKGGRGVLYLDLGPAGRQRVIAWNGTAFMPVLGPGDRVAADGVQNALAASVVRMGPGRRALIRYRLETGCGWAVHDGSRLTPLRMPGGAGSESSPVTTSAFCTEEAVLLEDSALVVVRASDDARGPRATLWRLTPDRADEVFGSEHLDRSTGLEGFALVAARPGSYLVNVGGLGSHLLLHHKGQLQTVLDTGRLPPGGEHADKIEVQGALFLSQDEPFILLHVHKMRGGRAVADCLYLYDGQRLRPVLELVAPPPHAGRSSDALGEGITEFIRELLVSSIIGPMGGPMGDGGGVTTALLVAPKEGGAWWFPGTWRLSKEGTAELMQGLSLASLVGIATWNGPHEALVSQEEGLYRLGR